MSENAIENIQLRVVKAVSERSGKPAENIRQEDRTEDIFDILGEENKLRLAHAIMDLQETMNAHFDYPDLSEFETFPTVGDITRRFAKEVGKKLQETK